MREPGQVVPHLFVASGLGNFCKGCGTEQNYAGKDCSLRNIKKACQELKYWSRGGRTNFTSMLYDLIAKADQSNQQRLYMAFPDEVAAFLIWQQSEEDEFFERAI